MFDVEIITPEKVVHKLKAKHLVAPGKNGSFGVLKDHAPLFSLLAKGDIEFENEKGKSESFHIEGGFLEMESNKLTILTESV